MLKLFFCWLLLQPLFPTSEREMVASDTECNCASATNLQKTGEASGSFSMAWTGHSSSDFYRVWYVRQSDGYTSAPITLSTTAHTFTGLSAGAHNFYVKVICGGESSGFIGLEDLIEN
ncbi:MAG: hypothetical protein H6577_16140 [Lewinellaceae bacterium]|nr:hypothetical protein [Saprospiraceae bacterium]MCB9339659.1 hypothetical protein [Lewinellaceae bacterium]